MRHDPSLVQADAGLQRLQALVLARLGQRFHWGVHDCCLWAADAVQALTGRDLAAGLRGTYSDAASAARLLQQLGGLRVVAARVGPEVPPLSAQVGDVGLIASGGRELLAVCHGAVWLAPAADGLAAHELDEAVQAWRVSRG